MIECYILSNKHANAAADLYFERYPERHQPHPSIFRRLENNLMNFGSFKQQRSKNYNKVGHEVDTIQVVGLVTAENTLSIRNIENHSGVSRSRALRILKKNTFKSYLSRKTQFLRDEDHGRRLNFCNWYLQKIGENRNFFSKIIWTDEAYICSNGIYNRQNNRVWAQQNPGRMVNRVQQGRFGFSVWCAILGDRILCYRIFDGILTSARYATILEDNIENAIDNMGLREREELFFQQDGAPPHNTRRIAEFLNLNFGDQWLGTNGPIRWPPRSPDLTPLDFFFWGFVKNEIYKTRSNTVEELREKFEAAIRNIRNVHIMNAVRGVSRRCRQCIANNGRQFEHLM